ncbi:MAG: TMEM175 family protein [Casimicrobiaceae bacterium]
MNKALPQRLRGLEKNRLEALIDGIFAVALTLLVLDIRLPDNLVVTTNADLLDHLLTLERHFVIYVVSFIVIGMYWINHHIQFHFVVLVNRRLIWVNLAYLLLVSFLPFATDLIGDHKDLMLPCELYGGTLLALSGISYLHIEYLTRHPELTSSGFTPTVAALIERRIELFALVPIVSMVVAFFSTRAAVYAYVLLVMVHFLRGRIDDHIAAPAQAAETA